MLIRPATLDDAEACSAIYAPYVTDSWISFEDAPPTSLEMVTRIISYANPYGWFVAEIDGQVCGYAYGSPHRTRGAYRTSCDVAIYVDPAFAGRGIGRNLYTALLSQLKDKGYHAAFAGITQPNAPSTALHETFGFTLVGTYREVGWKMGAWRDVSWWQRLL